MSTSRIWMLAAAMATQFTWTPAVAQTLDLKELSTPLCPDAFELKDGKCAAKADKLASFKDEASCVQAQASWKDNACKAPDKAPQPACSDKLSGLKLQEGKCVLDRSIPRSAEGDYLGDCFVFHGVPASGPLAFLKGGEVLATVAQEKSGTDPMLTFARADGNGYFNCTAAKGSALYHAKASEVIDTGAHRRGWVFGALAMPYKYYPKARTFAPGTAIGPYLGRRWGEPGSAYTIAAALTLGMARGEERDANNKIVATPDLQAISGALGVMWDLSKSPGKRPFKAGIFVGADRVNNGDRVKFPQNGKPWIAVQLGYDFTDGN